MRLGSRTGDEFMAELGEASARMQEGFTARMAGLVRTVPCKVMLGDATVTEQATFDPAGVRSYFEGIAGGLEGWEVQGVTETSNDDLRRMFAKFEIQAGSYLLSGHISMQYHVLLYYRPDSRVVEAQKELAGLMDSSKDKEAALADQSDRLVLEKLKEMGHSDPGHQELFEILFKDDELRDRLYSDIAGGTGEELQQMSARRQELFGELDSLLLETYQTSTVLIDDARLVTGEEGHLCTVDLEFVRGRSREGVFDPRKIPEGVRQEIRRQVQMLEMLIKGPEPGLHPGGEPAP